MHRFQAGGRARADIARRVRRRIASAADDFELRPPQPGATRPQEKSADQQAKQLIEQAGPGEPGKQASDFRLRRSEDGLPDIGARSGQAPDPNAAVADQSLSSKLLGHDGTTEAGGAVEKRETTPLKGVY
jgi:hypothetical protein